MAVDTAPKKNIIVCGYPKSGTTWLSRLIAELVDCPFMGSFGYSDGVALEGATRTSDYDCYKSHHTSDALLSRRIGEWFRIIYIVRDPRDVAISAAHYFQTDVFPMNRGSSRLIAALNARASRLVPYAFRRRRSIRAVLYGDDSVNVWLAASWRDHCLPFLHSGALTVKYEDLLNEPENQCTRILSHLGVPRSREDVSKAIANQSFQEKKRHFKAQGLAFEYAFLRRGGHGYWRDELGRKQKRLFAAELGTELVRLSYPVD